MTRDTVIGALVAARDYLRHAANPEAIYGYYPGGDPRDFSPDPECCTAAELAAHKEACAAWERGERPQYEAHHHEMSQHGEAVVSLSFAGAFGLGVYQARDEDADDVLEQIEAALGALEAG